MNHSVFHYVFMKMMQNTAPKSESLADNFEAGCILHICCFWRSGTWMFCFTTAKTKITKAVLSYGLFPCSCLSLDQ